MKEYTVEWVIQVTASCPRDAAVKAQEIQRDPESRATCFVVWDDQANATIPYNIDLEEPCEKRDGKCPKTSAKSLICY